MNEALLVRFRTDDTISNKGFMALFVAVDRQDSGENYGSSEDEDVDEENLWSVAGLANRLGYGFYIGSLLQSNDQSENE